MSNFNFTKRSGFKAFFFVLLLMFLGNESSAQYNITVGTGDRANGGKQFPCPLQDTFQGSRAQYLFRVSELKAAGLDSGTISSVAFFVTKINNNVGGVDNLCIKIGTTTTNVLGATTWVSNLQTVFNPKNVGISVGKVLLNFDNVYDWDGLTNLVLEVCTGSNISVASGNPSVLQTQLNYIASRSFGDFSGSSLCAYTGTGVIAGNDSNQRRPVVTFNWQPKKYCDAKPTVGNVTANSNLVCPLNLLTLTSTGGTFAALINYQWQYFDNKTNQWEDSGTVNVEPVFSLYQDTTTSYRLRAICGLTDDTAYSNIVTVVTPRIPGNINGLGNATYYINKNHTGNVWPVSDTFKTFTSTVAAMSCGIRSAVTFEVVPGSGPYNEQMVVNGKIKNASTVKTITYKGNGEAIGFATTTNSRAVIKLKGAKYFIFDSLMVNANSGNFGIGFQLQNSADTNVIKKCIINSHTATAGTGFNNVANTAGIVIGGIDASAVGLDANSLINNIQILNNKIDGGASGIVVAAGANGENNNVIIKDNIVKNFYQYGIYLNGTYNANADHNIISRPFTATTSANTVYGIYTTNISKGLRITRNRIHSPFLTMTSTSNSFNGISIENASAGIAPTPNDEFQIVNNLIYNIQGNGNQSGINNVGSSNAQFINNTVSLDDDLGNPTTGTTTRCYSQTGNSSAITLVNNIFTITRGGSGNKHTIYIGGTASAANFRTLAKNNYINDAAGGTTNYIGNWNGNRLTIADWSAVSNEDSAMNYQPAYAQIHVPNLDTANYRPTNAILDDKGKKNFYADIDIDGPTPQRYDVGCYEFVPPPCIGDSLNGITEIYVANKKVYSDSTICENVQVAFKLKIKGATGAETVYQWQRSLDSANTATYTNFGPTHIQPDTAFLSTAITPDDTAYYYRCKLICSGLEYNTNWRKLTVYPAMITGDYSINLDQAKNYIPGQAGGIFNNYTEAVSSMRYCGIKGSGPVVRFNVQPAVAGNYKEQITIDSIKGIASFRQVMFKGNNTTIEFPSTGNTNTERAIFKLKRALFINFDSIIVDASDSNILTSAYGFQFINNSDSNSIRNCTIKANIKQAGANLNFAGIVFNSADAAAVTAVPTAINNCDVNVISNNTIIGGTYGITLCGNGTSLATTDSVINNRILDFHASGIYLAGIKNSLISKNFFARPTRVNVGLGNGIEFRGTPCSTMVVSKNRFTNFFGGNPASTVGCIGISFNNVKTQSNIVVNNAIYNLGGLGNIYGMQNLGSDGVSYYHNSISIQDTTPSASATAGFYHSTAAQNLEFIDNMIAVDRKGTGNKYAINLSTTIAGGTSIISNYNNLFSTSYTGFYGAARKTLADWKVFSTLDANSTAYDPLYYDNVNGDLRAQFYLLDNTGKPGYASDDINNVSRAAIPDIGAFEYDAPPCADTLRAGKAVATPKAPLCLEEKIHLTLDGNSPLGPLYFQWQDSQDGTNWQNLGQVLYKPDYDTVSSIRNYYRCVVTCALNNASTISTVDSINLNNILPAGTYTIDSTLPTTTNIPYQVGDNFIDFNAAIAAMSCGIRGNVIFEVMPGFNNVYAGPLVMPYIKGANANATITFRGYQNNAAATSITCAGTASQNFVLRYDSSTWTTFRDLNIENTNAANGRVVEFYNKASNSKLVNCNITTPVTNDTTGRNAGVFANQFKGVNITVKGNNINNGSNGVYFTGISQAAGSLTEKGHMIDSNTVTNSKGSALFLQFTNKLSVTRNRIVYTLPTNGNNSGIYANFCDSGFILKNNIVNLDGQTKNTYGIQVSNSRNKKASGFGYIDGNAVYANTGNTGLILGITMQNSDSLYFINNIVAINSSANGSSGLVSTNHPASSIIKYYNNTMQISNNDVTSTALKFIQVNAGNYDFKNNIFSNIGGGKSMIISNPANMKSNYNMLYTTGTNLVTVTSPSNINYNDINIWRKAYGFDRQSLCYAPAFVANNDLHPAILNENSWAMQGRGVQIKGFTWDANNNYRPDSLTAGVPDLGAYEFLPSVLPPALPAIPATPQQATLSVGKIQTFYFGSDTVLKVRWDSLVYPPDATVRRYSGVVDTGIRSITKGDSMFFYTTLESSGGKYYKNNIKVYYLNPWLGSIPDKCSEYGIGFGRTLPNDKWIISPPSRVNTKTKEIREDNLTFIGKYTGLCNPFAPPPPPCDDTSNRGTEFWCAYPMHNQDLNNGNSSHFIFYFGTKDEAATVTVDIEANGACPAYSKTYIVPPFTVLVSDAIAHCYQHQQSGIYPDGIHITSDIPIVAYAHCWAGSSSGATMLMPVCTYGYDYQMLSKHEKQTDNARAYYIAIAKEDNTKIHFASVYDNFGLPIEGDTILNKGEWLQVFANSDKNADGDLTGSVIKAIPNSKSICLPFAFFSGEMRTYLTAGCSPGSGDFAMQQNFAGSAWGQEYLLAPTSRSTGACNLQLNLYRIGLKSATQKVYINGSEVFPTFKPKVGNYTGFTVSTTKKYGTNIPAYIEFLSDSAQYITSDRPITICQFIGSECGSEVGDPDMAYISPIKQGINDINFYRNTDEGISKNAITLIGSANNTPQISEKIGTGAVTNLNWDCSYNLSRYTGGAAKKVYIKFWNTAAKSQVFVKGDSAFTAITYGLGSVESYMYNAGTNIRNLNVGGTGCNKNDTTCGVSGTDKIQCAGTPFNVTTTFKLKPDSVVWRFANIPGITPNQNYMVRRDPITDTYIPGPQPVISQDYQGYPTYTFTLPQYYTIDQAGYYTLVVKWWNEDFEGCDKSREDQQYIQVYPKPIVGFKINPGTNICPNTTVNFKSDAIDSSSYSGVIGWQWSSNMGLVGSNDTASITYKNTGNTILQDTVKLVSTTAKFCVGDSQVIININPIPTVTFVNDSIHVCVGDSASFQISNPISGATYTIFDAPVNGNQIDQGNGINPFKFTGITTDSVYWVEAITAFGCKSNERKPIKIGATIPVQPIANPVTQYACLGTIAMFTATSDTSSTTVNNWYNVATGGTPVFSGNVFATSPVTGDSTYYLDAFKDGCHSSSRFAVNVLAATPPSLAVIQQTVTVCKGENASFYIANVDTSVKYNWYTSQTGGNAVTDTVYTITNATVSGSYYLSATSKFNCTTAPRLQVDLLVIDRPIITPLKDIDTVCSGSNATIMISNPIPSAIYTVYDAATGGNSLGLASDGTTPFVFNNVTASTSYFIEAKLNATGCLSIARKEVFIQVIQIPAATAAPTPLTACIGTNATFTVNNPLSNQSYSWWDAVTGGNQLPGGTNLVINNVAANASYYLEVKEWNCVSNSRFKVDLIAAVAPSVAVMQNPVTVCNNNNAIFNIQNPDNTVQYNWYTTVTGGSIAAPTGTSVTINNLQKDTSIYVDATSANSCTTIPRLKLDVKVTQRPVVTVINPDSVALCQGLSHTFAVLNPANNVTYSWYNVAGGGTSVKDSVNFTTPALGTGDVNYYVDGTIAGCTSVNRTSVKVKYLANLDTVSVSGSDIYTDKIVFDWTPMLSATGYIITVSVNGGAAISTPYGSTSLTHTVAGLKPGDTAIATVTAIGANNCQNSISRAGKGKTVVNASSFPNTFTPNGDGRNDKVEICGSSMNSIQYIVFNQWGEKIWEITTTSKVGDCFQLWDGTQRGIPQPVGVYAYIAKITYIDNTVKEKKGLINLVR